MSWVKRQEVIERKDYLRQGLHANISMNMLTFCCCHSFGEFLEETKHYLFGSHFCHVF